MQIAEYLVNLTGGPTQYFALSNKMKQISEMRDYIRLGKKGGLLKDCVTEHPCQIIRLYSSGDEHMSTVHR